MAPGSFSFKEKIYVKMESELDIRTQVCYHAICKANFPLEGNFVKNRLEEIRRERGVRQEELANVLEVSRQTISSLENGRYNPSIVLAFKIARYFNMSIEEIFVYEEDK
jgi:putative transcriptional regulator